MADFSTVTEIPDIRITREALSMAYTRYAFATSLCREKRVLEVACGVGQGLGLLARRATWLASGDLSGALLERVQAHYRGRVPLVKFDAQMLPFTNRSFEAVICYEAIYYLPSPERFVGEARRVLDESGLLVMCSANPERPDFNPSPMTVRYFSARELAGLMRAQGFRQSSVYGAFPIKTDTRGARLICALRRAAVALNLMPKTMKGKELLKRLFLGPLVPAPAEIAERAAPEGVLVPLAAESAAPQFQVIFAVGRA